MLTFEFGYFRKVFWVQRIPDSGFFVMCMDRSWLGMCLEAGSGVARRGIDTFGLLSFTDFGLCVELPDFREFYSRGEIDCEVE